MPKTPPPAVAELLTTAQVAQRLHVTVQSVHNKVKAGRLVPVTKLAGSTGTYLFSPTDVDALLAAEATS